MKALIILIFFSFSVIAEECTKYLPTNENSKTILRKENNFDLRHCAKSRGEYCIKKHGLPTQKEEDNIHLKVPPYYSCVWIQQNACYKEYITDQIKETKEDLKVKYNHCMRVKGP